MISKIKINNVATYKNEKEIDLRKISFFFGSNGSGKTTISRILSHPESYPTCSLDWNVADHEEILVFNRPFVNENFQDHPNIPGIFTLGEESIEIQNEIESIRQEINQATDEKNTFINSIQTLDKEIETLNNQYKEKCWTGFSDYSETFKLAFEGFRSNKNKFFEECKKRFTEFDKSKVKTIDDLRTFYSSAFDKNNEPLQQYMLFTEDTKEKLFESDLLGKVITGQSNTPVGQFIEYLKASDWVKRGTSYLDASKGKCPFCQREMPQEITNDILDFFAGTYQRDCDTLNSYFAEYKSSLDCISSCIQSIGAKKYELLEYSEFESLFEIFTEKSKHNIELITKKLEVPSSPVKLESLKDIIDSLETIINGYNQKIKEYNDILENKKQEREKCITSVWFFLINELFDDLSQYKKLLDGKNKGKKNIEKQILQKEDLIKNLTKAAHDKESTLTSVIPTVNSINKILTNFGFDGFHIEENTDQKGTYKIVRADGSDASTTLSEGEHNFLAFIYFYQLCFGSQQNTRSMKNKILVIDDPISSMDSNVLYIVSTLVKSIIRYCREKMFGINQVIILTHNIFFHKEITFLGSRDSYKQNEVIYFILRKKEEETNIEKYDTNPILSSYELLWEDIKNPDNRTKKSIFNTMRRILEYYFTVIGGIKYEEAIDKFEGTDKLICKALVSYINDGSHSIFDDFVVPIEDSSFDNYVRVFKLIFEKLGHKEHYQMMMRLNESGE